MTSALLVATTAITSFAVAVVLSRRLRQVQPPPLLPDELLPGYHGDLALVLRANAALGAWLWDAPTKTLEQAVTRQLDRSASASIAARLERLAGVATGGTELMEQGALVHLVLGRRVGAVLLPGGVAQARIEAARSDLSALLRRLEREPVLAAVRRDQDRPGESVESVAMRLAHQVERLLDAEACVAVARPQGVQVLGISLRSDPRLQLALAAPGSALDRVGRGIESGPLRSDDPLGRSGRERRRARPHAVVVPIPGSELPVGAVVVAAPDGALPVGSMAGDLLQALQAAGPRLARAIDWQELQETSLSDPLTGLRNRRGLAQALSRVEHGEGALIYADLDHFKRLNDTLGHPAGDAALVFFARVMGQGIRSGDVLARIGGEEFAVWLPDASLAEGVAAAERIRVELERADWAWQGSAWSLTASFGVAGCPETVPTVNHLADRADAALYQAKQRGRNRVEAAG